MNVATSRVLFCSQRYDYYYEVKDTTQGGDGETYSYNLWRGVAQVNILQLITIIVAQLPEFEVNFNSRNLTF